MTQQPGSGSGRNPPRRGGASGRSSDAGRGRKPSPQGERGRGGAGRSFPDRGRGSAEDRPTENRASENHASGNRASGRAERSPQARSSQNPSSRSRSFPDRGGRDAGGPQARSSADRGGRDAGRPAEGRPASSTGGDRRDPAGRAGAGRSTGGFPSSRSAAPGARSGGRPARPGAGAKQGARPGAQGGARQQPAGAKAFGKERFGQNLGPVRAPAKPRRSSRPADEIDVHTPEGVRLQKVMALAGVASRRVCEEMILDGRVEVDGTVVTELGVRVDPGQVAVHVDGIRLQLDEHLKYYVFNKPRGVVSTMEDPEGRPCIRDFLKTKDKGERLFHVGRLDAETEGLLLLTNDGELTNRLTHPSYEVPKTYLVQVRGPMAQGVGAQMKEGIELEDGLAQVDSFKLVDSTPGHLLVEVVLHSGRNRVVRRLFDAVGHPVERLVRLQVGPIRVGDQRQGSIRVLGRQEVGHLLASVGL
ncbi:pseudouridine synthase [Arthrobacter sp. RIT-PI-e]|uniref:pseudouridine synthase n=1 Tax=Arthrobacter sp. RIT-PI-e TaxID=1681197 RepID=UPI0009E53162|nr:pseudouridine synthase [Arthrobacter sp. RIT-PI-e]